MLQFFGQSLLYGNQYIYESMPRMLSLWLDYGAEVAEGEGKGKNEQVMKGMKSLLSQLNKVSSYWDWKSLTFGCDSTGYFRVPTAQGKQEKWPTNFPVRENTGNWEILPKHSDFGLLKL